MIGKILLIFFLILLLASNGAGAGAENQDRLSFERQFPASFYCAYEMFFTPEYLPFLGQLLTIFPAEPGQGYQLEKISPNSFALESPEVIQPGSSLTLEKWGAGELLITTHLQLRQVISFSSDLEIEVSYQLEEGYILTRVLISYSLPPAISGVRNLFRLITGQDIIATEAEKFLDHLQFLAHSLEELTPATWQEIREEINRGAEYPFPLEISPAGEQALLAFLLNSGDNNWSSSPESEGYPFFEFCPEG